MLPLLPELEPMPLLLGGVVEEPLLLGVLDEPLPDELPPDELLLGELLLGELDEPLLLGELDEPLELEPDLLK